MKEEDEVPAPNPLVPESTAGDKAPYHSPGGEVVSASARVVAPPPKEHVHDHSLMDEIVSSPPTTGPMGHWHCAAAGRTDSSDSEE
jgi:hypothetical protein